MCIRDRIDAAVRVVPALRPGRLGHLGVDELAHHLQTNRHRRGQQALPHLRREQLQLPAHLSGQPLRQRRLGQVDQPDPGQQAQPAPPRPLRVRRFLHWWSSFSTRCVRTPSVPHGTDEAEDRHSNFYDAWVNLPTGAATARPTPHSTASSLSACATTSRPGPTSTAAPARARANARSCAASNATSPARSTPRSHNPANRNSPEPLDIYRSITPSLWPPRDKRTREG